MSASEEQLIEETVAPAYQINDQLLEISKNLLPLVPLKNVVILPKSVIPIIAGRTISIKAIEYALKHDRTIFITTQKDSRVETPGEGDLYAYGTKATVLEVMRMPNGSLKVLAEGICRAKMLSLYTEKSFLTVAIEELPTTGLDYSTKLEAAWRELSGLYLNYIDFNDKAPADLLDSVKTPQDMDYITDMIAIQINTLGYTDRQNILETYDLIDRIILLCKLLQKEIEISKTEQKIRGHIQTQVEKNQREYYLTEQIKAIQKELGRDDQANELDEIRSKIKKLGLPKEALEKVEKEIRRVEQMPPLSSESVVSRNYIDWIIGLPWNKVSKDTITISQAIKILDKNHAGLKKLKDRIIEFVAAKKYSANLTKAPVICFVGPPGVGKTSLAASIADSLGREFVRIALGGIRDEAEMRGHRRTYIGALPGKIIQAMKKAKTINPVILLDEIDKMSRDIHGDPASALLEILDPEQNKSFIDHFLDVEYNLSQVLFIATANVIDNIPYPLLDRLEIISIAGYTEEEKTHIAQAFLIPKNLKEHAIKKQFLKFDTEIIRNLIDEYTKEAGVRQLDRVVAKIMRKTIQHLLENPDTKSMNINKALVREWLGNPTSKKTSLNTTQKRIGLATGLAWTEVGGDVLEIEVAVVPGKGSLNLTGQLGEVMQESAHAALSYIRSRAKNLNLKPSFHNSKDIHIHMPEGATPKDGPSAGITICTAVISALTNSPSKEKLAMTGEITLQGRVLAIGGLKEKLLSARQHGITTVIIPQENIDDLGEIIKEVDFGSMKIIPVNSMDEVLAIAFIKNPLSVKKSSVSTKKKRAVA